MSGIVPPTPSMQDLLDEVNRNLQMALSPSLISVSQANDAYELYLFSLVVQAAVDADARVFYETVSGKPATELRVRTTPGRIYSTTHDYTHAVLRWDRSAPLEAHVGVRVRGKSFVLHECDVAVLERREAELCRRDQRDPASSKLKLAVEAKFYSSTLPLHLAREFMGLGLDLSGGEKCFVSNSASVTVAQLLAWRTQVGHANFLTVPNTDIGNRLRAFFGHVFTRYRDRNR